MMMVAGVNTVWGQTFDKVYAFVADGHYMAHYGDVDITSAQAVTAPMEFKPNTCLWATTTETNNSLLQAYGTDSHNGGYYLKESKIGDNTFYNLVVNTTSLRYFQTVSTEPKAPAPTLTGNTTDANPVHYLRYDATNGWILTEDNNASTPPTVKEVTSITEYTTDPVLLITCSGITENTGAAPTLTASATVSASSQAYTHTVLNDTENHYWYDNADHSLAPSATTPDISSKLWSLASADLEYASIDPSTGVITVKKLSTTSHDLTLSCRAKVDENTLTATTTVTLPARDHQIEWKKYADVPSAAITPSENPEEIANTGFYQYSLSSLEETYEVHTTTNEVYYVYGGNEEHKAAAPAWGEASGLTMSWSLESTTEGWENYASIEATTGLLSVSNLPETGTVELTLKCTITKGGLTPKDVTPKTITLKPEALSLTISTAVEETVITATIVSSASPSSTIYYTTGVTEPLTTEPTTSTPSTAYTDPFTIDDDVACIKARVAKVSGEQTAYSKVKIYNILRFSGQIDVGSLTNVTVAPLVYSCDLETPSGMTAYMVSRVSPIDHTAILTPLVYIPEGVPVLLMDNAGTYTGKKDNITLTPIPDLDDYFDKLPVNTDAVTDNDVEPITDAQKAGNLLCVTSKKTKVDNAQVYMYHNGEFVLTLSGEMKAGRYYLSNPNYSPTVTPSSGSGGNARLRLVIEGTTGIGDVRSLLEDVRDNNWYTLDGRRLSGKPTNKGVYINDGRKIVVK